MSKGNKRKANAELREIFKPKPKAIAQATEDVAQTLDSIEEEEKIKAVVFRGFSCFGLIKLSLPDKLAV